MSGLFKRYDRRGGAEPAVDMSLLVDDPAALETAIDLLLTGRYLSVPEGDGPLTRKLKALADSIHGKAESQLDCVVGISMSVNDAVTATAQMMREVRDVDHRSQAIAAAAEEMVASVQGIATSSSAAVHEAHEAEAFAGQARDEVVQAVQSMETIARAVEDAATTVDDLAAASAKIGDIVQQIEAIAKQTNLLALNATIEAARAGDAGKGFAVVASEVKTLANQTAKATDDIRTRIEGLRDEMARIVSSMQEGADAVEKGQQVIATAGETMRHVTDKIAAVTGRIDEISGILGQQGEASGEVSAGIAGIAAKSGDNVHSISGIIDEMDKADAILAHTVTDLAKAEIHDFTVRVAKSDHVIWRKRLAQMVAGRLALKSGELADHHQCRLGKWYDAVKDPQILAHPAYQALQGPHAEVHAQGIQAARCYEKGDIDGTVAHIEKVGVASQDVLRHLDDLARR